MECAIKININQIVVIVLLVAIVGWLGSGSISTQPTNKPDLKPASTSLDLARIQVKQQTAITVHQQIYIHGRTFPSQQTQLRAEFASKIINIAKDKGTEVKKGELLMQLDPQDLPSLLRHGKALVNQRTLEYEAANRLKGQKLMAKSKLAEAKAQLEAAKANVDGLTQRLNNTSIRAPFDGIFSDRFVDIGHLVKFGDQLGTFVNFMPMLIRGLVPEKNRHKIKLGQAAEIYLLNGQRLNGEVHYIASTGNDKTHTFVVEINVPMNSQNDGAAGITARVAISGEDIVAHLISPALFELNAKGHLGVKVVDKTDHIIFVPIEIVKADETGTWVTGLDPTIDLVVVGQGYVKVGQQVEKVYIDDQIDSPESPIEVTKNTIRSNTHKTN
ncbi:MAG: efflux RND transporter periplasmic adaptor subunit [Pseudomonadales bacterium]|nr:efflux RND transporter periplasmic adaptor subunit [Pseudomonadales bacterium]